MSKFIERIGHRWVSNFIYPNMSFIYGGGIIIGGKTKNPVNIMCGGVVAIATCTYAPVIIPTWSVLILANGGIEIM